MAVSPLQKTELLSFLAFLNAHIGREILDAQTTTDLKSAFNMYHRRIDKMVKGKDYSSGRWHGVRDLKPADPICPWCGRRYADEEDYEDHLRECSDRRNPEYE